MRSLGAAMVVVAVATAPATAQQRDAGAIISRAARAYAALSSFTADFRQRIIDPAVGNEEARGALYQQGTNRFAMRFSDPKDEVILVDGTRAWVYLPSTMPGQVLRSPMPSGPVYGYNLLAFFLDRPTERYRVSYVREETVDGQRTDAVLLEPRDPSVPFRRATVWVDRGTGLPRRVQSEEKIGLTRIVDLTRLRPNAAIPAGTFTFSVPAGIKVVDQ
jgi:outer membrane lipoprotein carrier protein